MTDFRFLKKEKWHCIHVRHRTPFYVHLWSWGLAHPKRELGFDYACRFVGHLDGAVILDRSSFDRQRKDLLSRMQSDPLFLKRLLDDYYALFQTQIRPAWEQICRKKNLREESSENLAKLWEGFFSVIAQQDGYILLPLYIEEELSQRVRQGLSERFDMDTAHAYVDAAFTQVKDGLLVEEKRSLLKMALLRQQGKAVDVALARHVQRFSWMANQLYTMDFQTPEHYLRQIEKIENPALELDRLENERQNVKRDFEKVLASVSEDRELTAWIQTAQESIFFRNFRTEKLYESSLYVRPLFAETARRVELSLKEVVFLTATEMIELLRGNQKADGQEIRRRKTGFALLAGVNDDRVVSGSDLERLKACIRLDLPDSSQVQGQKAYLGKVKGVVYLVKTLADLNAMPQGAVLVSPSTSPAYVPALSKVSAIVTDEGGILCHTAVISREMKIPCVIGTKNATRVLQTGDRVEVDADAGTVRKIS